MLFRSVVATAPGIFTIGATGLRQAAVLNQDNSVNGASSPAARGSVIQIYATGEGQTSPAGIDGRIARGGSLPKPLLPVQVWVDGKQAEVHYAGAAPDEVAGLFQLNVRIPPDSSSGDVSIEIHVGDAVSQAGMTISVK